MLDCCRVLEIVCMPPALSCLGLHLCCLVLCDIYDCSLLRQVQLCVFTLYVGKLKGLPCSRCLQSKLIVAGCGKLHGQVFKNVLCSTVAEDNFGECLGHEITEVLSPQG